jgi:hypothetical protein
MKDIEEETISHGIATYGDDNRAETNFILTIAESVHTSVSGRGTLHYR